MNHRDLHDEMEAHLQEKIAELMESGVSEAEARAAARRAFGSVGRYAESSREVWRWPSLDRLGQDIRYGCRMMARNPVFTAVVVLTLALGIGVNTAIFSVVNRVLIEPLPYPHPERLVWITNYNGMMKAENVAAPDYFDWRSQAQSFDALMGYGALNSSVVMPGDAFQARTLSVTGDFWTITGAHTVLGRGFGADDRDNVVVLANSLFETKFHGDPGVIGKPLSWAGRPVTVIGVMAPDFRFLLPLPGGPVGRDFGQDIGAFMPSEITRANSVRGTARTAGTYVIARRRPGVSLESARAEMEALEGNIAKQWASMGIYSGATLRLQPAQERLVGNSRQELLVLLAAVGFVLLIACANVANLLLARATARQKEISIRAALGAGRARVIRQFLTESVLLAIAGGAAGLALARWGIALLARFGPTDVPRLRDASIDMRVLGFTLAVSLLTGLLFGIAPALSLSKSSVHDVLKESGRTTSASSASRRLRDLLAAGELALALVLLAGAGLMVKSFWRINELPAGFNPERTLVMKVGLAGPDYGNTPKQIAYVEEALRLLQTAPEVEAAAIHNSPLWGLNVVEGAPEIPGGPPPSSIHTASADYPRAIGFQLLRGRWLTDHEPAPVVVVNEAFARRVAREENPIGKRVFRGTIVGVVSDLRTSKLDADPEPEVYVPYRNAPYLRSFDVVIRTVGNPAAVATDLRKLVSNLDPSQPVYDMQTLDRTLADSIAPRRFNMLLLGVFAAVAVILAAVGIYGVMAYAVTQRTQEIGVRMALGAREGEVVSLVVRQGIAVAAVGVAAGLGAALALTRWMGGLLYDVKPTDPQTFVVVCAVLTGAAMVACWLPARRAARVDPVVALRYE